MKRIDIDERCYRVRRGKLVEIPLEWVGCMVHPRILQERKKARLSGTSRHVWFTDAHLRERERRHLDPEG